MASKTFHFPGFSLVQGDIKVDVSLNRFERQYERAQYYLDSQIMTDMVPYMPHRDGNFVNVTRLQSAALAGSGKVVAAAPPMGRFLYEGKVMVDPVTGSPWARKGAKKVVTERPLTYSNPKATPHWFDTAKDAHGIAWVKGVKRIARGGKK
ncbi:minor capsid protein [Blautia hydrogenotrophica]|uniref:minor capsid protein n=1 Tax=Blautia hydrogenotrophica TaxID=53443 RepID=UPI0029433C20|nr:minor capsid protein [Blautia hydrogenotrophica]